MNVPDRGNAHDDLSFTAGEKISPLGNYEDRRILVPRFRPLCGLAEQIGENIGRQNMRIDLILHHPFSFFCQGKHQLSQGSPRILVALHILVLHELAYRRRGKPQVACQNLS